MENTENQDAPRKKSKYGRKKKKAEDSMTKLVTVRFTPEEKEQIDKFAASRRISLSLLLRISVFHIKRIESQKIARVDIDAVGQLRKIGVNLNQAVRALNQAMLQKGSFFYSSQLRALEDEVQKLSVQVEALVEQLSSPPKPIQPQGTDEEAKPE